MVSFDALDIRMSECLTATPPDNDAYAALVQAAARLLDRWQWPDDAEWFLLRVARGNDMSWWTCALDNRLVCVNTFTQTVTMMGERGLIADDEAYRRIFPQATLAERAPYTLYAARALQLDRIRAPGVARTYRRSL